MAVIGPVFNREVAIAPRRPRIYIARAAYGAALGILMGTAWLVLTGTQLVRDTGDLARFGAILFQILAPLQLALVVFFSAMLAASAVAQEKDRKTLVLLLLTNLSNSELVLGKLLASLLYVLVLLAAALPLFMLTALFGGVSFGQIARVFAVTLATALACGSLGSTLALWREKTFQALALTVLALVLWLAAGEVVAMGVFGQQWGGVATETWAVWLSPWRAILEATRPHVEAHLIGWNHPVSIFVLVGLGIAAALSLLSIGMVRVWNGANEERRETRAAEQSESRESIWGVEHDLQQATSSAIDPAKQSAAAQPAAAAPRTREVWDNPILWREMRTWAYGRRILVIRLVYLALFALAAAGVYSMVNGSLTMAESTTAAILVPLFLLSLVLLNAQAVTALTSERDGRALDLLLVTDLNAKEIVFGKLGGIFYNTKEMVLGPMLLCGYLWWNEVITLEHLIYLLGGLTVLYVFAAMLGVHCGMVYANSRAAIGTSLGTIFFLFLGVAVCMRMMVAFSGSFQAQLQPFLAFMIGGGIGLYVALGARNPSTAIGVASFLCPIATFYAITSYLLDYTLGVFLVTAGAYGFTTAAMMVPAIYEFDVATGKTTIEEQ